MHDFTYVLRVVDSAYGMAIDIRDLERIARIEAHLDAKMQRLLTLLRDAKTRKPAEKCAQSRKHLNTLHQERW